MVEIDEHGAAGERDAEAVEEFRRQSSDFAHVTLTAPVLGVSIGRQFARPADLEWGLLPAAIGAELAAPADPSRRLPELRRHVAQDERQPGTHAPLGSRSSRNTPRG